MTKRSAMLIAAGLVAALGVGTMALSIGLSGNGTAAASDARKQDPIVRTIHRTVTVEKKAKGDGAVQVITLDATSGSTSGSTSSSSSSSSEPVESESSDDGFESESESEDSSDDAFEDEGTSDDSTQSGSDSEDEDEGSFGDD
jgi:hypothetical protein